jgi:murein DD-endopeptidase MepM/ murein hydrolase activator NlpD
MRLARSVPEFTAEHLRKTVEAMPTPVLDENPSVVVDGTPVTAEPFTPPTVEAASEDLQIEYVTRPGDTLGALTARFGFSPGELQPDPPMPLDAYLPIGQRVSLPNRLEDLSPAQLFLPDAEVVYSPTASDFDVESYIRMAGGYLNSHSELVENNKSLSGAEIVQKVASDLSVNPRLLLAIIDLRSGWLFDHPPGAVNERYPIGFRIPGREGLYEELRIAATQLNVAYYGWRTGDFISIEFEDGPTLRLYPTLNAGSVALMHLFTYFSGWEGWVEALYGPQSLSFRYHNLFGDAWSREQSIGFLLPDDLAQPEMVLPFLPDTDWSLTAGPHNAWNAGTPLGALDFAPVLAEERCAVSSAWVTASAPGQVVRARHNVVALDLDGDGYEGTGWVLIYYHISEKGMVGEGVWLERDQSIGHPSCEGGRSTGTHVHVARKYNGEWLPADGPVPFVMSGWQVQAGERIYAGSLVKGEQVVTADPSGRARSAIQR